jgi:hypothetical protein
MGMCAPVRMKMPTPPFVSTLIALALVPVAFLFVHAFLSGWKGWRFHKPIGALAIIWDLSISIGYMLYRSFGGTVEGSQLDLTGGILAYFIVHGTMAIVVIALEITVLLLGVALWKGRPYGRWHRKLSKVLFGFWWFAFLTGEMFYLTYYIL